MTMKHAGSRLVYLARHGETGLNRTGYIRGHADPALDPNGLTQAEALCRILARVGPVDIACSPLARAVQTAEKIAQAAHLAVNVDERLIDREFGQWTGFLEAKVASWGGAASLAPGVERDAAILERAMPASEAAADAADAGPVVLVTHDAIIRALFAPLDPVAAKGQIPTGSWSLLTRCDGQWAVGPVGSLEEVLVAVPHGQRGQLR